MLWLFQVVAIHLHGAFAAAPVLIDLHEGLQVDCLAEEAFQAFSGFGTDALQRYALVPDDNALARINYLAYAPEIAAVMLRRQQASAIITAREKIVEGAVSMVKMALNKLSSEEIVELDDDKKAAMVSNLLVVLCGDDNAQPVVNTGTLNH